MSSHISRDVSFINFFSYLKCTTALAVRKYICMFTVAEMFLQCTRSLHDYKMLKYLPPLLAAGAVFVAVKMSGRHWACVFIYFLFIYCLHINFVYYNFLARISEVHARTPALCASIFTVAEMFLQCAQFA